MPQNRTSRLSLRLLPVLFGIAGALLSSACMWGVVRDAQTAAPVVGAKVLFSDGKGNGGEAFTDAGGIYRFLPSSEPGPVAGVINFAVSAPGYETLGDTRTADFADAPACFIDLPASCEVQSFDLEANPGTYRNAARKFSIALPDAWGGWEIWPSDTRWDVWMNGNLSSDYSVSCGVASHALTAGEDAETWWNRMSDMTGGRRTRTHLDGLPATRITYSSPGPGAVQAQFVDLARHSGRAWALACFGDSMHLDEDRSAFEGLEQGFRFEP